MRAFSSLIDALAFAPSPEVKLCHLVDYFGQTGDPDRGYGLAILIGALDVPKVRPAQVRTLIDSRVDKSLFDWSLDFVGDLAETVGLIWPGERYGAGPRLADIVIGARSAGKTELPDTLADWLDASPVAERTALVKLFIGGLRLGITASLAREALARFAGKPRAEIDGLWHGVSQHDFTGKRPIAGRVDRADISQGNTMIHIDLAQGFKCLVNKDRPVIHGRSQQGDDPLRFAQ